MDNVNCAQTIISRKEAALCGLSRFYTGRLCKLGHSAPRYVSNKNCVTCNSERAIEREKKRSATDPSYRMYRNVQRRSGQVLLGKASASDAIGCGHAKLRKHIENQFTGGMSWEKYGQWEVDHIVPLSNGQSVDEFKFLCNYLNLQPLWKRDNLVKGSS